MRMLQLPRLDDTLAFGRALGRVVGPGDLVILTGSLGAGKTALTKGIAVGMGVTGTVMSPTFVIARMHQGSAITLVHVDAYRLDGAVELDDLDLDTDLSRAVVVIEWGEGLAEQLSDDRLMIRLIRHPDDTRTAELQAAGSSWTDRLDQVTNSLEPAG